MMRLRLANLRLTNLQLTKRLKSLLVLSCVLLFLTGCGARGPESKIVKKAIALEFQQTQDALSQQLRTKRPKFKIQRVSVEERTPMRIQGLAAYHLQGHYDAEVKFPGKRYSQTDNAFDLYVQQLPEGDLWRLAVPPTDQEERWTSFALYDEAPEPEVKPTDKPATPSAEPT